MKKFLAFIFGISLLNAFNLDEMPSQNTIKPSFDCTNAKTKNLICNNKEIASLDRYLNEIYTQTKDELQDSNVENKALNQLLESQKTFINDILQLNTEQEIITSYEKRTIEILQILGEILDSNNKELCEYARINDKKQIQWQEIKPSKNFLFTTGLCAFGRNNKDVLYETFCDKGKAKMEQIDLAIKEQSPYITTPQTFIQQIDIDNDGKLDNIAYTKGSYFSLIWAFQDDKINEKLSDMFYGDDLHFSGANTYEYICINSEELCKAISTYNLPTYKISQGFTDEEGEIMPLFGFLYYGVLEFKGKNYISIYNARFDKDEHTNYLKNRIYLLQNNKRTLQCVF